MKCLVVDDSAITRRILIHSLRAIGFTKILEAVDGKQALEACEPDVDIVVTDWNMPGMPGVELVRSLRANPAFASIPVLLITARAGKEDVIEAAAAGVNGYIIKPFTPEVLRAKIQEALVRPGANGAPTPRTEATATQATATEATAAEAAVTEETTTEAAVTGPPAADTADAEAADAEPTATEATGTDG